MQGGLDYDIQRKDIFEYLEALPEASAREIISQWLTEPLCYEPGTRFVYSMSFDVLGATGNRILTRESIDNMRTSRFDTPIKKADYRKARDFGYEYELGVRTLVMPETSADSGDICSSPPGWRG